MTPPASDDETLLALLRLLSESKVCYLSSVRPDGRPHCVPIWHVLGGGRVYHAVAGRSVKAANVRFNPHVVVAARLEIPEAGLIVEGRARLVPELRAAVTQYFIQKYEWDITQSEEYDSLIEVTPERVIAWGAYGEGHWTGEQVLQAAGGER